MLEDFASWPGMDDNFPILIIEVYVITLGNNILDYTRRRLASVARNALSDTMLRILCRAT